MNALGELVKNQRLMLGMTQAQLAKKLGLEPSFVSRVESGQVRIGAKRADKLASVLKVEKERVLDALKASEVSTPSPIKNYELPSDSAIERLLGERIARINLVGTVGRDTARLALNDSGETTGEVEPFRVSFLYPQTIAVAVRDSSFAPVFLEGDKLIFAPVSYLPGDMVLVKVKGGAAHFGKIAFEGDKITLEPLVAKQGKVQVHRSKVAFVYRLLARLLPQ